MAGFFFTSVKTVKASQVTFLSLFKFDIFIPPKGTKNLYIFAIRLNFTIPKKPFLCL